ncbi:hypothetical protein M8037_23450, partial [Sinorhizobium meliloti]|nr:hypothetical protein [Sinorhizobium meliloti]
RKAGLVMLGGEHKYTPAPHSGGGGSMPSAVQPDCPIFVSEGQNSRYPVSRNDSVAIKGLRSAMQTKELSRYTIEKRVNCLYNFSRWLLSNHRLGFADRLDSASGRASLDRDLKAYQSAGGSSDVAGVLEYLTNWKRGAPLAARPALTPHPDDATFIDKYKEASNNAHTAAPALALGKAGGYASELRHFSQYLRQNGKPGIVAQIGGRSLDADLKSYIAVSPGWRARMLISALAHFGTHLRPPAIGPEIAPAADPENAVAMRVGDGSVPGATEFLRDGDDAPRNWLKLGAG